MVAEHPDHPLKLRPLARALDIPDEDYAEFRALVRDMLREGALVHGPSRSLALPKLAGAITGVYRPHRRGFGFLIVDGQPDLYVPRGKSRDALDGDQVLARPLPGRRRGEPPRVEIIRVLRRAQTRWVGILEQHGRHFSVQPQGRVPTPRVLVTPASVEAFGAARGDLVVVEPSGRFDDGGAAQGEITERLGDARKTRVKLLGVARRHGLPGAFPDEALAEAEKAATAYMAAAPTAQREDLRGMRIITIDPVDAKDFDDAISIERLEAGAVRLGVHIADVAHFVPIGGALDQAARERGLSVYFPGRVIPMLPEPLSNGVCSLQPDRDRLTKSVFITYDRHARVVETRFANSIIRSSARLTYEQASAALQKGAQEPRDGKAAVLSTDVVALLREAEKLARRIQARRTADGMISLESQEVEIELNERDEVVDARPADQSYSHKIIEMFMVEANEAVSRELTERGLPHPRRVHPEPEPDAGRELARMLAPLGERISPKLDRLSLQKLLKAVHGRPEQQPVNFMVLRSMPQAYYSAETSGHFALASEHYCHFTSPIRRYPDLAVHRALNQVIVGGRAKKSRVADAQEEAEAISRECSAAERRAVSAERESKLILLLELMKTKWDEELEGVITGVTPSGVFVQSTRYLAEGFVPVQDLPGDRWMFDPATVSLMGARSGRVIRIGQVLKVTVEEIDDVRYELRFLPVGPVGSPSAARPDKPGRKISRRRKR